MSISLILGFFAYIFLNGKNTNEVSREDSKQETVVKKKENKKQLTAKTETVQTTSNAEAISAPTPTNNEKNTSIGNTSIAPPPNNEVQVVTPVQSANTTPVETVVKTQAEETPIAVEKTPVKKAAAIETTLSKKEDSYSEESLLKKLNVIKKEMKRTKSYRVKYALETDANDICALHYEKLRESIRAKWANSRSLASVQKQKLKTTLQNQLIFLHQREKSVKSRLPSYLYGKAKDPFPSY